MKIKVSENKGARISIRLPLGAVKWKIFYKYSDNMKYYPFARKIYYALKEYIKENGHFVLVDVQDAQGSNVKIII